MLVLLILYKYGGVDEGVMGLAQRFEYNPKERVAWDALSFISKRDDACLEGYFPFCSLLHVSRWS